MEKKIAFLDYLPYLDWAKKEISKSLKVNVDSIHNAKAGITRLTKEKFSLIITCDELSGKGLILPKDIPESNLWEISRYIIKKTREEGSTNKDTPIFVMWSGHDPAEAYLQAGATDCFNWWKLEKPSKFPDYIKKYL